MTYGLSHQTVARYRAGKRGGWGCVTCGQWWVSTASPTSTCPGVLAFRTWEEAQAAGLHTETQWRAKRRKVLPDAQPRGAKMRGAAHPSDWYDLYAEDQTSPMRAAPRRMVVAEEEAGA